MQGSGRQMMKWSLIFLLFCSGCITTQSGPGPVPLPTGLPPSLHLPLTPHPRVATINPREINTRLIVHDLRFEYPSNECVIRWTLQSSTNLMDWVDLQPYGIGCPTNFTTVTNTGNCFYRLKGSL